MFDEWRRIQSHHIHHHGKRDAAGSPEGGDRRVKEVQPGEHCTRPGPHHAKAHGVNKEAEASQLAVARTVKVPPTPARSPFLADVGEPFNV